MARVLSALAGVALAAAHATSIAEMWATGVQVFTHGVGGPDDPEQVSIALGATPDAVAITWVTPSATNADNYVQYDYVANRLANNVSGSATSYTTVGYASGAIHRATVSGLLAGMQVWYRVGGPSGWSANFSFVAPRGVGASVVPYTFAVIGDLGQTANSNNTIYHVLASTADSAFIAGDISYADSDQPRWDSLRVCRASERASSAVGAPRARVVGRASGAPRLSSAPPPLTESPPAHPAPAAAAACSRRSRPRWRS